MKAFEIELLGSEVMIKGAKNQSLIGLKGRITGETRNLIVIETKGKKKKVIKSQVLLELEVSDKKMVVDGKDLVGKSEERIK